MQFKKPKDLTTKQWKQVVKEFNRLNKAMQDPKMRFKHPMEIFIDYHIDKDGNLKED